MVKQDPEFKFIIFDLDNTLYPREAGLLQEVGHRIQLWLRERLGLTWEQASSLRRDYFRRYGTTMGGLIAERAMDPADYLAFVHDIPVERYLTSDPALADMLAGLPLRRVIYTNATTAHARRVLGALGVADQFERIIGIEEVDLRNKPYRDAYERVLELLGAQGSACIMVEDAARNLAPAKALGMATVLVGSEAAPEAHVDFVVRSVLEVGEVVRDLVDAAASGPATRDDERLVD